MRVRAASANSRPTSCGEQCGFFAVAIVHILRQRLIERADQTLCCLPDLCCKLPQT